MGLCFCGKPRRNKRKKIYNEYKREKAVWVCESGGACFKKRDGAVKVKFIGYAFLVFVRIPPNGMVLNWLPLCMKIKY